VWFDPTVTHGELTRRLGADAKSPLDFPVFRVGSLAAAEQEERLRYLLLSGVPFAAITRASICQLCAVNEQALIDCVAGQTDFHRPPAHIRGHIEDDLFRRLTILWDDFDNNPFLHTYS
jgi:hypothetical protein